MYYFNMPLSNILEMSQYSGQRSVGSQQPPVPKRNVRMNKQFEVFLLKGIFNK